MTRAGEPTITKLKLLGGKQACALTVRSERCAVSPHAAFASDRMLDTPAQRSDLRDQRKLDKSEQGSLILNDNLQL
jgi:hypothetical protein